MLASKYSIVLIDDEKDLLNSLSSNLQEDFQVSTFTDPHHALQFLQGSSPDAIILDYHIPGVNTFEIFQQLRSRKVDQPVLFLTGETDTSVKVNGLDLGADDFLQKPITTTELKAYLNNRIRSYKKKNPTTVKVQNLEVNLQDPQVTLDGRQIALTPKEFEILSLLVTKPNTVIRKSEIVRRVWPDVTVEENNLDTHLSNLRKKLRGFSAQIKTIKCVGYVLRC